MELELTEGGLTFIFSFPWLMSFWLSVLVATDYKWAMDCSLPSRIGNSPCSWDADVIDLMLSIVLYLQDLNATDGKLSWFIILLTEPLWIFHSLQPEWFENKSLSTTQLSSRSNSNTKIQRMQGHNLIFPIKWHMSVPFNERLWCLTEKKTFFIFFHHRSYC